MYGTRVERCVVPKFKPCDMLVGQIAVITKVRSHDESKLVGTPIIRSSSCYTCLADPNYTWHESPYSRITEVEILTEGERVVIEVQS